VAPVSALESRAEHFDRDDRAGIHYAGSIFAAALAEIAHHEIGEPGCWDCYGTTPDELARLRDALARMEAAIGQARAELVAVERRARLRAMRGRRGGTAVD
jgi:hypothetical protein